MLYSLKDLFPINERKLEEFNNEKSILLKQNTNNRVSNIKNDKEFHKSFIIHNPFIKYISMNNLVILGGSVIRFLTGSELFYGGDIDFFIVNEHFSDLNKTEYETEIMNTSEKWLNEILKSLDNYIPVSRRKIIITKSDFNINISVYDLQKVLICKLQLIICGWNSVEEIVNSFDIHTCCAVYNPLWKNKVLLTKECAYSLANREIILDFKNYFHTYEMRIVKYINRGFSLRVSMDINRFLNLQCSIITEEVNELDENELEKQKELERLKELEKLKKQAKKQIISNGTRLWRHRYNNRNRNQNQNHKSNNQEIEEPKLKFDWTEFEKENIKKMNEIYKITFGKFDIHISKEEYEKVKENKESEIEILKIKVRDNNNYNILEDKSTFSHMQEKIDMKGFSYNKGSLIIQDIENTKKFMEDNNVNFVYLYGVPSNTRITFSDYISLVKIKNPFFINNKTRIEKIKELRNVKKLKTIKEIKENEIGITSEEFKSKIIDFIEFFKTKINADSVNTTELDMFDDYTNDLPFVRIIFKKFSNITIKNPKSFDIRSVMTLDKWLEIND